jgi:hypothetical protein
MSQSPDLFTPNKSVDDWKKAEDGKTFKMEFVP